MCFRLFDHFYGVLFISHDSFASFGSFSEFSFHLVLFFCFVFFLCDITNLEFQ